MLYNHGDSFKKFREFLLTENLLEEVLDLSPVRKEIFKNANAPAVILTYKKSMRKLDDVLKNEFTHISLKPNIYFELFDILAIEKNDVKYIKQDLLYRNDWAWKVLLYQKFYLSFSNYFLLLIVSICAVQIDFIL